MILSCSPAMLRVLAPFQLERAILERREAVRYLRDQQGDDRCFLDRYKIWGLVISSPRMPRFTSEEGLRRCTNFFNHCRTNVPDAISPGAACDISRWDSNISRLPHEKLLEELLSVQRAIVIHRDVEKSEGRFRDCNDDRRLMDVVLPELVPCDFRLPSRKKFLLGGTSEKSGCPAFWASHSRCVGHCDLHRWGPCN